VILLQRGGIYGTGAILHPREVSPIAAAWNCTEMPAVQPGEVTMNRFDWTFSGSAELVTGLLLVLVLVAAVLA
jgi:hypothetical protein